WSRARDGAARRRNEPAGARAGDGTPGRAPRRAGRHGPRPPPALVVGGRLARRADTGRRRRAVLGARRGARGGGDRAAPDEGSAARRAVRPDGGPGARAAAVSRPAGARI